MRGEASESMEQAAVFEWAAWMESGEPRLGLLYHVPNGGWRHPATAARMKAEGVKAGVPDLCLPVPCGGWHGLYIELKKRDGKNRASAEQKRWIGMLREQGYRAEVAFGADEAIGLIGEYLGMKKEE